jgi:hypothetical protein
MTGSLRKLCTERTGYRMKTKIYQNWHWDIINNWDEEIQGTGRKCGETNCTQKI